VLEGWEIWQVRGFSPRFGHRNHIHCQFQELGMHQVGPQSLIFDQRLERHEHVTAPESKPADLGFVSLEFWPFLMSPNVIIFAPSIFTIQ
jgi:hypothetical protein